MKISLNPEEEIDVRPLPPIKRHQEILHIFEQLPVEESFIFINDHDPLPLFYELKSVHGDVIRWEYLQRGGKNWKVKVTRTEESRGKAYTDFNTLMDLRNMDEKLWNRIIFHRYGMMQVGDTMELISKKNPIGIHKMLREKFMGKYRWEYKTENSAGFIIHLTKLGKTRKDNFELVDEFDIRSLPPQERHERFYQAFKALKPGQGFRFINDHDPIPLYYQMEAESKNPFKWEYIEKGPEKWKVQVVKLQA